MYVVVWMLESSVFFCDECIAIFVRRNVQRWYVEICLRAALDRNKCRQENLQLDFRSALPLSLSQNYISRWKMSASRWAWKHDRFRTWHFEQSKTMAVLNMKWYLQLSIEAFNRLLSFCTARTDFVSGRRRNYFYVAIVWCIYCGRMYFYNSQK